MVVGGTRPKLRNSATGLLVLLVFHCQWRSSLLRSSVIPGTSQ